MIEISHLTKSFHKKIILNDISFHLDNRIYGLLGPNGSGKTTLFRIMTNLISMDKGKIFCDKDLEIGYLPQRFNVLEELTVYEQMYYFSALKRIPKNCRNKMIEEVLLTVHLDKQINERCDHLSGGMLRRLGIAQAIIGHPKLVLLDEPTVGLDPEERLHFKTILKTLEGKFPIILSTHIVEDIEDVCHEVLVLYEGNLLFNGSIQDFQKIAENRVYEVPVSSFKDMKQENCFVEKYTTKHSKEYVRIISDSQININEYVPACIEDSYMYLIKRNETNKK